MYFVYIAIMFPIGIFLSLWLADLIGIEFTSDARNSGDDDVSLRDVALVVLWLLGPMVAVYAGVSLLDRIRRWLFPSGIFAIGNGVDRHNSLAATRRVIGGGVVLALVISVLGSWIYAQIS